MYIKLKAIGDKFEAVLTKLLKAFIFIFWSDEYMSLKTTAKVLVISLLAFLAKIFLYRAGYEFRYSWLWLAGIAQLAFPVILSVSLLYYATRIRRIFFRMVTVLIVSACILCGGLVYFRYVFLSPSAYSEYLFRSPSGENKIIVAVIHGFPHYEDIRFYEPKFFILKKDFNDSNRSYSNDPPPERSGYTVEWSQDETVCTVKWKGHFYHREDAATFKINRH